MAGITAASSVRAQTIGVDSSTIRCTRTPRSTL